MEPVSTAAGCTKGYGSGVAGLKRLRSWKYWLFGLVVVVFPASAGAAELFGGIYSHDVDTPLSLSGIERGVDFQLGWRGDRIEALRAIGAPSPHVFSSVNSAGDTNFAAAGLSWKLGDAPYIRPGVGLAVHDSPSRPAPGERRIDFGSRVLFQLEFAVGVPIGDRVSVEASWVHLSHAQLFGSQNPGMDAIGLRLNYRLR